MKKLTEDEKVIIENLYKEDIHSFKSIGIIIGRDYRVIKTYLESIGCSTKSKSVLQRKYPVNENYFDKIDTEQKAYILGFLYADGCNSEDRNSIIVNLNYKDKDILEKIKDIIQPTKPLQYVNTEKINKVYLNSENQYRLVINNKHISQQLSKLGCVKAKTHKITFPSLDIISKNLQKHFIRGYFDGDGSISGDKQKQFSLIGTAPFINTLQDILIKELNFSKTKLDIRWKERDNNTVSLRYSGINQCIIFRDWLYDNSTIYMERKRNIFYLLNEKIYKDI